MRDDPGTEYLVVDADGQVLGVLVADDVVRALQRADSLGWSAVTEPTRSRLRPMPTGAARRRGPLAVGDQVQLTDPKGKHHTFTLTPGKDFHTHRGSFSARRADRRSPRASW